MDNLYDLDLLKILTSSISEDKNVQAIAKALTPELQSVSRDIREALIISRIDELPEAVLDLLAWQWHVDVYSPDLPISSKRALVKGSISWHRKKGTLWAVKKVLQDLGIEPIIYEWFDLGTRPYTFAIDARYSGDSYQAENIKKMLLNVVEMAKPARAHLEYLALIPDPPDIGLPDDHICRYDYCHYSHGYWPRPVDHWGRAEGESPVVCAFCRRGEIRRMIYNLAPVYGASRYDNAFFARWYTFSRRIYIGHQSMSRTKSKANIWTIPFALGVYSGGEPMGSLNCVYAPRYRYMASPGAYGTARYGDLVGPTEWRHIYRFYSRIIPLWLTQITLNQESQAWRRASYLAISVSEAKTSGVHKRGHWGTTFRIRGKRGWLGKWQGKWTDDVDESIAWTKKISVIREEQT